MRIKSIHLKNFKRFTDLLIKDIPKTAKLVVVVGPMVAATPHLHHFNGYLTRRNSAIATQSKCSVEAFRTCLLT